jgi:hypothetical protein
LRGLQGWSERFGEEEHSLPRLGRTTFFGVKSVSVPTELRADDKISTDTLLPDGCTFNHVITRFTSYLIPETRPPLNSSSNARTLSRLKKIINMFYLNDSTNA